MSLCNDLWVTHPVPSKSVAFITNPDARDELRELTWDLKLGSFSVRFRIFSLGRVDGSANERLVVDWKCSFLLVAYPEAWMGYLQCLTAKESAICMHSIICLRYLATVKPR